MSSPEESVHGTFEMQVCVSSWNEIHAMRFLIALNILLSLSSSLGNTIILVALRKETSLHAPSKLMYILPGEHRSVCWFSSSTSQRCSFDICNARASRAVQSDVGCKLSSRRGSIWDISVDINRNKR